MGASDVLGMVNMTLSGWFTVVYKIKEGKLSVVVQILATTGNCCRCFDLLGLVIQNL